MKKAADVFQELCLHNEQIPDVFEFLASTDGLSDREQVAVMLVDQYQRWQKNQVIPVHLYLEQTPDIDDVIKVDLLVEEYGYLDQRKIAPTPIDFANRFHSLSPAAKQELFEALEIDAEASASFNEDSSDPSSNATQSKSEPERVGRYEVIRLLGRGAFGKVFLARDPDLDRSVAIKVPNNRYLQMGGGANEFLSEARAVAKLDHPNIVPVYDCGMTEDDRCFVVSKFIRGKELKVEIRKGMSHDDAARITATIARALHVAHSAGIVHRDVKPGNILIDSKRQPHLLDFGLARRDFKDGDDTSALVGTPAYMSPEQAMREGHRVDGRSDIYSLGVILYEMLTGHRPFPGDSEDVLLEQVKHGEVPPPRQSDDSIPALLETVCLKALSRELPQRYNTAKDMADDLESFLTEESIATASTSSSSGRSIRQEGGPATWYLLPVTVLSLVAMIGVLSAVAWFGAGYGNSSNDSDQGQKLNADASQSEDHDAEEAASDNRLLILGFRSVAEDQQWFADAYTELLTQELQKSTDLEVISCDAAFQSRRDLGLAAVDSLSDSALKRLKQRIGPRWIIIGSVSPNGFDDGVFDVFHYLKHVESPSTEPTRALIKSSPATLNRDSIDQSSWMPNSITENAARIRECLGRKPLDLTRPGVAMSTMPTQPDALRPYFEGVVAMRRFDFETADEKFSEASKLDPKSSWVNFYRSVVQLKQGNEALARRYADQAVELSDAVSPTQRLRFKGHALLLEGKPVEACTALNERCHLEENNFEAGVDLANALTAAGRGHDALELLQSFMLRAHPAELPPLQLAAAEAAQSRSEYALQLELVRNAIKVSESIGAHRFVGLASLSEGEALRRLGEHEEAEIAFDRAVKRLDQLGDKIHAAQAMGAWGKALVDNGELDAAEIKIKDAMRRSQQCNNQSLMALHLGQLGELDVYRGKFDDAAEKLQQAADEFVVLGNRQRQADMNLTLANVVARKGDSKRAIELIGTARSAFQASGDRRGEARTWGQQGAVHGRNGEIKDASRHFTRAMELFQEVGDQKGEVTCIGDLATTKQALGQLNEAGKLYSTALEIHKRLGSQRGPAMILYNLGVLYTRLGRTTEAIPLIENALKEFEQQGNQMNACFVRRRLGQLQLEHGNVAKAKTVLTSSLAEAKELGSPNVESAAILSLGNVAMAENKYDQASKLFQQAREIRETLKQPMNRAAVDLQRVRLLMRTGDIEAAYKVLKQDTKPLSIAKPEYQPLILAIQSQLESRQGNTKQAKESLVAAREKMKEVNPKDLSLALISNAELVLAECESVAPMGVVEQPPKLESLIQQLETLQQQCRQQGEIQLGFRLQFERLKFAKTAGHDVSRLAKRLQRDASKNGFSSVAKLAQSLLDE